MSHKPNKLVSNILKSVIWFTESWSIDLMLNWSQWCRQLISCHICCELNIWRIFFAVFSAHLISKRPCRKLSWADVIVASAVLQRLTVVCAGWDSSRFRDSMGIEPEQHGRVKHRLLQCGKWPQSCSGADTRSARSALAAHVHILLLCLVSDVSDLFWLLLVGLLFQGWTLFSLKWEHFCQQCI